MKKAVHLTIICLIFFLLLPQCRTYKPMKEKEQKVVIYQVLPRLFGNTNNTNIPWGTIEENGVGRFVDITDQALR